MLLNIIASECPETERNSSYLNSLLLNSGIIWVKLNHTFVSGRELIEEDKIYMPRELKQLRTTDSMIPVTEESENVSVTVFFMDIYVS